MMAEHSADVRVVLEAAPASAAAARDAIGAFDEEVPQERMDDLRLLVSELVTNSYLHAGLASGDRIELRGSVEDATVRVEVRDVGPGFAPPDVPTPWDDGGWGLYLVDRLADRWGVGRDDTASVWLEIDL